MIRGSVSKTQVRFLTVSSILLLITSIGVHLTGDFVIYRALRGCVSFFFLGWLVYQKGKRMNPFVGAFMLLYGLSSIATIGYENKMVATASLILNLIAFIVLIGGLFPKIDFRKMNLYFGGLLVILVLVNAYLLYSFVAMLKDFALSDLHYLFMLLGAMSLVLTGFLALLFNHQVSSGVSLLFTIFIFVLIFSEVFRAMGYYDIDVADVSVYLARATMILAFALLTYFELSNKKAIEQLGRNHNK